MALITSRWTQAILANALLISACTVALPAQVIGFGAVTLIGSEGDERQQLAMLADTSRAGFVPFRSLSLATQRRTAAITILTPEVRLVTNSALPFSMNDGPLWAGRGTSAMYTAGVDVRVKMFRLVVAPQVTTAQNLVFQTIPYLQGDPSARNVWANPFYPPESSIDLPMRFGDRRLYHTYPGQSSLTVTVRGVAAGVGTENIWWGPAHQNGIVLSNNAAGFAHAFLRTRDGVETRVGRFDAQLVLGRLDESDFFDADSSNDSRALSGLVLAYTPSRFRGFTFGLARAVIAPLANGRFGAGDAFNVFRDVGHPNTNAAEPLKSGGLDQITALFTRVAVPQANFEAYAEWARFEQPLSLRDFLEWPGHSQGYTLGLQWGRPLRRGAVFRLAAEVTNLEPDASLRVRPVAISYTSRAVVQGFSNKGQALGAGIGPGSSSEWLSADIFGTRFRAGAYLTRIRWDDATLWTDRIPQVKNEDVSLIGGVQGSATFRGTSILLSYARTARLDYLYQDKIIDLERGSHGGVDILNRGLSVTLTTAVSR